MKATLGLTFFLLLTALAANPSAGWAQDPNFDGKGCNIGGCHAHDFPEPPIDWSIFDDINPYEDSDGDGVPDSEDQCEGDDSVDSDSDGIPDDCDDFSNPPCGSGDSDGDSDYDGIPDSSDDYSNGDGDSDGDGVPDSADQCEGY